MPIAPDSQLAPLLAQPTWDEAALAAAGIPIEDAHFVTVGGGLGSFAVVDFLRIAGLPASQIRVLSNLAAPYETFAALASASQLGAGDRLRSDSSSTIHNIWGWPGYALSEAWSERTLVPLWRVVTEPLLSEYFTPRVRTVIAGLERETARIGWGSMLVRCWAEVLRRRAAGGYFVLARSLAGSAPTPYLAYRCQHVHVALGHPGPRVLPEVAAFRARHGDDAPRVVNAYEPHEHVYARLVAAPGQVVVVRGAGITASRILERLIHDRDTRGAQTQIVHLFRHYVEGPVGPLWFRRPGGDGFAYQAFNFPRGAGGGQLRKRMLAMSGEERAHLTASMGGATTAYRRRWQRQLRRGRREGWYRTAIGEVSDLHLSPSGQLAFALAPDQLTADFLIDATGVHDSIARHALLADLLAHGGASLNPFGRLDVEPSFELRAMRSGAGRMYVSGAATLGGALAPVDSFWGLTHAAMEITDDLADQGTCEFPGVLRSLTQWWRWVRNQPP